MSPFLGKTVEDIDQVLKEVTGPVFSLALAKSGNWHDAQDLCQEILIEIVKSLPGLRNPGALLPWALTIAKRICLRHISGKKAEISALGTDEYTYDLRAAQVTESTDKELAFKINGAVTRLSRQHRAITELFYFQEIGIADIGRKLGLPQGTVKRRLYESREALRKELITMSETQEIRKKATSRPFANFMWWRPPGLLPGTTRKPALIWPWTLIDSLLAQQILFAARKQPKSNQEIAREVGADLAYIQDYTRTFVSNELMRKTPKGFLTDFFFIDESDAKRFHKIFSAAGKESAQIFARHYDEIRKAVKNAPIAGNHTAWEEIQWVVICVFASNLAVGKNMPEIFEAIEPPIRPDGHRAYLFAWQGPYSMSEGGWARKFAVKWVTGCNIYGGHRAGFFWSPNIKRKERPGRFPLMSLMPLLDSAGLTLDEITEWVKKEAKKRGNKEPLDVKQDLARLAQLSFIVKKGKKFSVNFPVFTKKFWDELTPIFLRTGAEIASKSVKPVLESLDGIFDEQGFSHLKEQYLGAKAFLSMKIFWYSLHFLNKLNILPQPPGEEVEPNWGFWGSQIPIPLL